MSGAMRVDKISAHYWDLVPTETRAAIAAAVPDGQYLVIYPGYYAKPGTATVSLRDHDNHVIAEARGTDLATLARYVLAASAMRVTVDRDGFITDIEDL